MNLLEKIGLEHLVNNIKDRFATKEEMGNKVDKVTGKGLSTNDFTTPLKDKLDGIEEGADKSKVTSVNGQIGDVIVEGGTGGSVDIADDLVTDDSTKALSARQGKVLNEKSPNKEYYEKDPAIENNATGNAEGYRTIAFGYVSHAEGYGTEANGDFSHSQNYETIAQGNYQTVIGMFNTLEGSPGYTSSTDYAFIIGNGEDNENRSNAMTVNWQGDLDIQGQYKSNGIVAIEPTEKIAWERYEVTTINKQKVQAQDMGGATKINIADSTFGWAVNDIVIGATMVNQSQTINFDFNEPAKVKNFVEEGLPVLGINPTIYRIGLGINYPLILGDTDAFGAPMGAFVSYGEEGVSISVDVLGEKTIVYSDDEDAFPHNEQEGDYYYIKMSPIRGLEERIKELEDIVSNL